MKFPFQSAIAEAVCRRATVSSMVYTGTLIQCLGIAKPQAHRITRMKEIAVPTMSDSAPSSSSLRVGYYSRWNVHSNRTAYSNPLE